MQARGRCCLKAAKTTVELKTLFSISMVTAWLRCSKILIYWVVVFDISDDGEKNKAFRLVPEEPFYFQQRATRLPQSTKTMEGLYRMADDFLCKSLPCTPVCIKETKPHNLRALVVYFGCCWFASTKSPQNQSFHLSESLTGCPPPHLLTALRMTPPFHNSE